MKILLFLLLFGITLHQPEPNTQYVDKIECHTLHDNFGFPVFSQFIFYEWSSRYHTFIVRQWKIAQVWDKTDNEHHKLWLQELRQYCDKYKKAEFHHLSGRYLGKFNPIHEWPKKDNNTDYFVLRYYDDGICYTVMTKLFSTTDSQIDPEKANRDIVPEEDRNRVFKRDK